MNFVEAARSGKRIRRPGFCWCHPDNYDDEIVFSVADKVVCSKTGLLADDWEVEGEVEAVTLTGAEFVKKYKKAMRDEPSIKLMKALGF